MKCNDDVFEENYNSAIQMLECGNVDGASSILEKLRIDNPSYYKTWYGSLILLTNNFSSYNYDKRIFKRYVDSMKLCEDYRDDLIGDALLHHMKVNKRNLYCLRAIKYTIFVILLSLMTLALVKSEWCIIDWFLDTFKASEGVVLDTDKLFDTMVSLFSLPVEFFVSLFIFTLVLFFITGASILLIGIINVLFEDLFKSR